MSEELAVVHDDLEYAIRFSDGFGKPDDEEDEPAAAEVDIGGEITFRLTISCPHGCDLTGQEVSIRDENDQELAQAFLGAGDSHQTDWIVVPAPERIGTHSYRAVVVDNSEDGTGHRHDGLPIEFTVNAHAAHLNVWGAPSAVPSGEDFSFKVSVKCSSGCKLHGRAFRILDQDGTQVAADQLGSEAWPGTEAVYFAEVKAKAPPSTGSYRWIFDVPAMDGASSHSGGSLSFGIRVVDPPSCEVTIEAFDAEKQAPIKGLHVLMHPYRSTTDEHGVARVKIAKGSYKLHVSGYKYLPFESVIEAEGDVTMRAELVAENEVGYSGYA